jgi:hypothetical protein
MALTCDIGLLVFVGHLRSHLRRDATAISSALAAAVTLISIDSFAGEGYQPLRGQEERRATKEGALVFRRIHEQIIRSSVLTLSVSWGR